MDHFKCDSCGIVEHVNGGLPKNWVWVKTGGEVKHACGKCKEFIPADKKRVAGEKG